MTPEYLQIRDKLKTGDVLLFSGKGRISKIIQLFGRTKWSHVGMVVRSDDLDALFCWESTSLSVKSGSVVQGVQLNLLSERIRDYDGSVALRPLVDTLTQDELAKLRAFRAAVKGRPYEKSRLELAFAALDFGDEQDTKEDLSSIFCSECIGEAFQRIGRLASSGPDWIPSNEYEPADFSQERLRPILSALFANQLVLKSA